MMVVFPTDSGVRKVSIGINREHVGRYLVAQPEERRSFSGIGLFQARPLRSHLVRATDSVQDKLLVGGIGGQVGGLQATRVFLL